MLAFGHFSLAYFFISLFYLIKRKKFVINSKKLFLIALFANLPDIDFLIPFLEHRTYTHSILILPLIYLLTLTISKIFNDKELKSILFLAYLTHFLGDLLLGSQLCPFYPFKFCFSLSLQNTFIFKGNYVVADEILGFLFLFFSPEVIKQLKRKL
jgi:membrane-bound metal-dependent hydrolase YbcI (DUF457 family)